MEQFAEVYERLNTEQREAVDAIDGPVLVVAGPGTGKTQLLGARVANILRKTDTLPQNILCLTFTESGAANMRERLTRFIGREAYDVQIGTYHAFGGDIIKRYPEYFSDRRLDRPIDELGKHRMLANIVERLPYASPLKTARYNMNHLITAISDVKKGLLTPKTMRDIAADNVAVIQQASTYIQETFTFARMPGKNAEKLVAAEQLSAVHAFLRDLAEQIPTRGSFSNLAWLAAESLGQKLETFSQLDKPSTAPLTEWKNNWLVKDGGDQWLLKGSREAARLAELANVLEQYDTALQKSGQYDFDDMILQTIQAMETNDDLRFTLQERYQYILLDEFQDTNASQMRIVELLTDNPVHEGRPNVLAVGDDDQAIYAFQGAQYSNMLDFYNLYRDVLVVNLIENYRSTPEILQAARNVAGQITDSLVQSFASHGTDLQKTLVAKNKDLPATVLQHTEYTSEIAERAAIAGQIKQIIADGLKRGDEKIASKIAVLSPKHEALEELVPHLDGVPVRYDKRENILEAPVVRQLLTMSKLVLALHEGNLAEANGYWPEVLSYEWWGHNTADIWRLSWQARNDHKAWSELLLENKEFSRAAHLLFALAGQVRTEPLEVILDRLSGTEAVATGDTNMPTVSSPLRAYITRQDNYTMYKTTTELTVLRKKLREHQDAEGSLLFLPDLLAFVDAFTAAEQKMLNTSPYNTAVHAVQLMTVFSAKGLEWEYVFLLNVTNDMWNSVKGGGSLTLPANLAPIRRADKTEDELLRIFFVAITRAKHSLYISSHTATYAGKKTERLKFLDEAEGEDKLVYGKVLPEPYNVVAQQTESLPPLETLETDWRLRHTILTPELKDLLQPRLGAFRLSATDLVSFLDVEHGGPTSFLLNTLLRFPGAPNTHVIFGTAMHGTLEFVHKAFNKHGVLPTTETVNQHLREELQNKPLTEVQRKELQERGELAFSAYLANPLVPFVQGQVPERSFRDEGVVLGDNLQLSGKIDLLEIDEDTKTIIIVDYKSGSDSSIKRHKYALQLYFYKLLLRYSATYKDYAVHEGKIVYIEPDDEGKFTSPVRIRFNDAEFTRVEELAKAVWQHIHTLDFPDVSAYPATVGGWESFEQSLLGE